MTTPNGARQSAFSIANLTDIKAAIAPKSILPCGSFWRSIMQAKANGRTVSFRKGEWAARKAIALMKQRIEHCEHHACEATMRRQLAEMENEMQGILAACDQRRRFDPAQGQAAETRAKGARE